MSTSSETHRAAQDSGELVLRIWPSLWDLPSFTPECVAAVLYLQHALPGEFVVEECTNPDLSPNGAHAVPFIRNLTC